MLADRSFPRFSDTTALWRTAPSVLEIHNSDIHIWLAPLDSPPATVVQLQGLLSPDERNKARRFYCERDGHRFVAGRAMLRSILGRYLGRPPRDVRFDYEPHGKPQLQQCYRDRKLHFNVSHSNGMALVGICLDTRIGIDIEFKDRKRASLAIAQNFFAPEEVSALSALNADAQCEAFFRVWTRKEAYVKGRGEGVSLGFDTFAVTVDADQCPTLVRSSHGDDERRRWRFWTIDAGADYAATLAADGPSERRLSLRVWPSLAKV
jgi:4'-phosphopantetheinyl transferase